MYYALGLSWLPHVFPKTYVKRLRTEWLLPKLRIQVCKLRSGPHNNEKA